MVFFQQDTITQCRKSMKTLPKNGIVLVLQVRFLCIFYVGIS